jgi:uncharacterized protein
MNISRPNVWHLEGIMSLLQRFRFSASREEVLAQQVTVLQSALAKCRGVATRWQRVRGGLLAFVAIVHLGLGFVLGIFYGGPVTEAIVDFLRPMGLAQSDSEAGYAAYEKGSYRTALRLLRPLAEKGDARAQSTVGLMYYKGNGVAQDDREAFYWFRLAADQGDARAQFNLGGIYFEAQGVPQDFAEAAKWWRLAADHGYPQAQYNLGLWFAEGKDGSPDNIQAHMWLNLAAAGFLASDNHGRDAAIRNRDVVASKMTTEQITQAQRLARDWKPKTK